MKEISARVFAVAFSFCLLASVLVSAQQPKPGVLNADDLKRVAPTSYFFGGQSAPVQLRNSVGFRATDGKLVWPDWWIRLVTRPT